MKEMVLLGDEAVALGAIHSGATAAFGYPGTPSTEILEYILDVLEKNNGKTDTTFAQWCTNEKTAYESALGASFAGKRTLVTMKHVGLNVAADPFMNSSLCGINGGLIVIVADDPSMHSSQGEQDSRFFSDFAMVPCFEPTNQQEAYDMMFEAFELSEKMHVPVMYRLVTRLSHSRSGIITKNADSLIPQNELHKGDRLEWMLLPALARKNYANLLEKQKDLIAMSAMSHRNPLVINEKRTDLAIITSGLGRNYFLENLDDYTELCEKEFPGLGIPSTLHIGMLPLPKESIDKITSVAKTILIIEEGQPVIEKQIKGLLRTENVIIGKFTGHLPRTGELNPDFVRKALGLVGHVSVLEDNKDVSVESTNSTLLETCTTLPGRPPQLCRGCPHIDSFTTMNMVAERLIEKDGKNNVYIASDIGCYALGAVQPLVAGETIVCMGASLGMARGAACAGVKHTMGVIGDSTFLHSGITNLIDAVSAKTPMTAVILDNSIVAMTGCQTTILPSSQLQKLIEGIGVEPEHIHVLNTSTPKRAENADILQKEVEYRGVSVIIMVRECLEAYRIRTKKAKAKAKAEGAK